MERAILRAGVRAALLSEGYRLPKAPLGIFPPCGTNVGRGNLRIIFARHFAYLRFCL